MNGESSTGRSTLGVALLVIAGVAFIVGAFITAGTLEIQGQSTDASLWDGWEGKASLILGIVLLAAGVGIWSMRERGNLQAGGVVIVVLGIAATALALFKIFNIESEAVNGAAEAAAALGAPLEAAKQQAQQLFDSGAASISAGIGLYLVVIAGIITVVGGLVLAMGSTTSRTETPAPPME